MSSSARDLVYTSVDDCRISLGFVKNIKVVEAALYMARSLGDGEKTRIKLLEAKIKKLKKEQENKP